MVARYINFYPTLKESDISLHKHAQTLIFHNSPHPLRTCKTLLTIRKPLKYTPCSACRRITMCLRGVFENK